LEIHGLDDWSSLHRKGYSPTFKPGKSFIKEAMSDKGYVRNLLEPKDVESFDDEGLDESMSMKHEEELLTLQQNLVFNGFRYTQPRYEGLFKNHDA
jgi:hypothetical protein